MIHDLCYTIIINKFYEFTYNENLYFYLTIMS